MALFSLETFKGRTTVKMESNSKLENTLKVKPYPVDLPVQNYAELSTGYEEHLSMYFTLAGEKVAVTCENVGRLEFLRDGDLSHFILVLHSPEDETQVAVYLKGKWWAVGDVLKTSSKSRCGLVLVESVMERVVLFLLSQIVFGTLERPLGEDVYFSTYSSHEHSKIVWLNGGAVGFYTVKKKGSLCDGCTSQSYLLPVLDTVFVRSHFRRAGLALQMLQDFCSSQSSESILGISFPMSPAMYGVCKKYLEIYKEERERLYEVEAPGEWAQRRNVWLNIQLQNLQKHRGNSEQSSHRSCIDERSETELDEERILGQGGSLVNLKDTSSLKRKQPADQTTSQTYLKKAKV